MVLAKVFTRKGLPFEASPKTNMPCQIGPMCIDALQNAHKKICDSLLTCVLHTLQ